MHYLYPPEISVLLCARNEGNYLRAALESLVAQATTFRYEIVVVDNASSDNTAEIARHFTSSVYSCHQPGKVPALMTGARHISTGIAALADADTLYPSNWLSQIHNLFHAFPKAHLVFGSSDFGLGAERWPLVTSLACSAIFVPALWCGAVYSMGFNMAVRTPALREVLAALPPFAMSGWAIGNAVRRLHGSSAVVYARRLQVPKCMRRYKTEGFGPAAMTMLLESLRVFFGRPLKLSEATYYKHESVQ